LAITFPKVERRVLEGEPRVAGGEQVVVHLAVGRADVTRRTVRNAGHEVLRRDEASFRPLVAVRLRLPRRQVMLGEPLVARSVASGASDAFAAGGAIRHAGRR